MFSLEELGYSFIEAQIELRYHVKKSYVSEETKKLVESVKNRVAFQQIKDEENLERVLDKIKNQEMFVTDRIYLDKHFTKKNAGERYYWWCRDLYEKGGEIYETLLDGKPIGMNALTKNSDSAYKGAIGGTYLECNEYSLLTPAVGHLFFEFLASKGMKSLSSAVSSNNVSILKLNLASGYYITGIRHVYVKHNK